MQEAGPFCFFFCSEGDVASVPVGLCERGVSSVLVNRTAFQFFLKIMMNCSHKTALTLKKMYITSHVMMITAASQ